MPGGLVGDAHRRVGGVHRLAARSGRPVHVDLQVLGTDLDVHLLGLRQHGHGRRRRVQPSLGLGDGHALHAVDARFVLQARVRVLAAHLHHGLLETAALRLRRRQQLGLPAMPFGVAPVHVQELRRPQGRLLTARSGADLHDDVLPVVRILGDQQQLERAAELLGTPLGPIGLVAEEGGHLRLGLGGLHLPRLFRLRQHLPVLAVRPDDLLQLGERTTQVAHALLVVGHVGRGQLGGDRFVAGFDLRESIVEWSGHASIIADDAHRSPRRRRGTAGRRPQSSESSSKSSSSGGIPGMSSPSSASMFSSPSRPSGASSCGVSASAGVSGLGRLGDRLRARARRSAFVGSSARLHGLGRPAHLGILDRDLELLRDADQTRLHVLEVLDQRLPALGEAEQHAVGFLLRALQQLVPLLAGLLGPRLRVDPDAIGVRTGLVEHPGRVRARLLEDALGFLVGGGEERGQPLGEPLVRIHRGRGLRRRRRSAGAGPGAGWSFVSRTSCSSISTCSATCER